MKSINSSSRFYVVSKGADLIQSRLFKEVNIIEYSMMPLVVLDGAPV